MNSETVVMCVVALILGMLLAHMLKSVCGCKVVEAVQYTAPRAVNGICCCGNASGRSSDGRCDNCDTHNCFNHSDCYNIGWDNTTPDFKPPSGDPNAPLCENVTDTSVGECSYVLDFENGTDSQTHFVPGVTQEACATMGTAVAPAEWTKTP